MSFFIFFLLKYRHGAMETRIPKNSRRCNSIPDATGIIHLLCKKIKPRFAFLKYIYAAYVKKPKNRSIPIAVTEFLWYDTAVVICH